MANNSNTRDVANHATLGTSDDDDTLASSDDICSAANEGATHALQNPHTNYYTITGYQWI